MSEGATQLADARPQFDVPLRVAAPANAPVRIMNPTHDDLLLKSVFSCSAYVLNKQLVTNYVNGVYTSHIPSDVPTITEGNDASLKTATRDFQLLAQSSKRAGKKDVEATAYISLGIINDNNHELLAAIKNYKDYLTVCEEIGDTIGASCACNCIGVDYMLLACPNSDSGTLFGCTSTSTTTEYLNRAIYYHSKHLEISPDNGGKFVASINLGLCLGMVGDIAQAAKSNQEALRIAIKMQTLYGQSIAVGNLGNLAIKKKDYPTAKTCFEQHLQLIQALVDPEAELKAWMMLAKITQQENKHDLTVDNLQQALKIAIKENLRNEIGRINSMIGISKGNLHLGQYCSEINIALESYQR